MAKPKTMSRRSPKLTLSEKPGGKARVWIYVVGGKHHRDLATLDSVGFEEWRANKNTKRGDLILMYRSRPFSDIAYVLVAGSDPYETEQTRYWDWKYGIRITGGFRLPRVITLKEMQHDPKLKGWSFCRHQQGIMDRKTDVTKDRRVWNRMREMLEERGADLPKQFGKDWTPSEVRQPVFISYVREDKKKVDSLRDALAGTASMYGSIGTSYVLPRTMTT